MAAMMTVGRGVAARRAPARCSGGKRATGSVRAMAAAAPKPGLDDYGKNVFKGAVAESYLKAQGLSASVLDTPAWTGDEETAEKVAAAMKEWAIDRGATSFAHLFQPMGSSGVRHGQTACVQMSMVSFSEDGSPSYEFDAGDLLTGETDGSSYPNGGIRATHTAGGYLAIDPISPVFVRGDVMFIPAAFIAYSGEALDEKTPLHRACAALSSSGKKLLAAMGCETAGIINNIGLEQEIFLVPREAYYARPDLQLVGRTLIGAAPARGQEMSDHYMAPPTTSTNVLACMQAIQDECFKVGIPLKTRHREVAPNQYEFAPLFGDVRVQTDQNLMVMQIIEETAAKYNLAALLQEKPFKGINGSGKHNNWSFATAEGVNLLNPGQTLQKYNNADLFPVICAAVVRGIDMYGDLMRLAIASPGNDFRLGAMEAPPAVMSTYLGPSLTSFLEKYAAGEDVGPYTPAKMEMSFGVDTIRPMKIPSEDRNRTSPFPYGGMRFEFRAAGSSQNVSLINTVLNTLTAEGMKVIAERVEAGESPRDVASELLKKHMKCVFNGNGYDPSWPDEAVEKGIWRIDSGVEAIKEMTSEKNVAFFKEMGIFTEEETKARQTVLLEHYTGTVLMEALCLKDMIKMHVIPSCIASDCGDIKALRAAATTLSETVEKIEGMEDPLEQARASRSLRLDTMDGIRALCDDAEAECKEDKWTLASYKELLFLDSHTAVEEFLF